MVSPAYDKSLRSPRVLVLLSALRLPLDCPCLGSRVEWIKRLLAVCSVATWLVGSLTAADRSRTVRFLPVDKTSSIRIMDKGPKGALYGLRIKAPWRNGGELYVNLPEHLEMQGTVGILRWSDAKRGASKGWVSSADGLSAHLEVESPGRKGVLVKGETRVVAKDRVQVVMTIENGGNRTLTWLKPLYCVQYRKLTGFPGWVEKEDGNRNHTFLLLDGNTRSVSEILKREGVQKPRILKGLVKDSRMTLFEPNVSSRVDIALVAVSSIDNQRKLIVGWTPGSYLLANPGIPCLHADGFYEPLKKGESGSVLGTFVFTDKDLQETMLSLKKEGIGMPHAKVSLDSVD